MQGLVLEGGGLRGLFTCGVMDVLMEHGWLPDGTVGVSAGACFGVNIKSGQIGRGLRYNLKMCGNPRYKSIWSLLFTGDLFNANYCYHVVPNKIDIFDKKTFEASPQKFWLVTTDINTMEPVYHLMEKFDDEELEWIRASASLPMVARAVTLDGRTMLDGGLTDSVPLKFMQDQGYDKNLVVLTRPRGYRKEPLKHKKLIGMLTRHYTGDDKVLRIMDGRADMYNAQMDYVDAEEAAGCCDVIAPPCHLPIGRIEMTRPKLQILYDMGRKEAEEWLEKLKN